MTATDFLESPTADNAEEFLKGTNPPQASAADFLSSDGEPAKEADKVEAPAKKPVGWDLAEKVNPYLMGARRVLSPTGLFNFLNEQAVSGLKKAGVYDEGREPLEVTPVISPEQVRKFMEPVVAPARELSRPILGPDVQEGVERFGAGVVSSATSPDVAMPMLAGTAPIARPVVGGYFRTTMGAQVPEQATAAVQAFRRGDIATGTEATLGAALGTGVAAGPELPSLKAKGETLKADGSRGATSPTMPVSEFGGVADLPVPEKPETIEAQLQWLKDGKRKAVLVTPGGQAPETPAGMEAIDTTAGKFIFDPKQTTKEEIQAAVSGNKVGDVLGYGIGSKPADAVGAVVVRGADGGEKSAVVTDQNSLPNVVKAATDVADPKDTVTLESGEDVIADRKGAAKPSRIEQGQFRDMLDKREDLPAELVQRMGVDPTALPEGYSLEKGNSGTEARPATPDRFVFSERATGETPAARMVREQREAMEAIRKEKAKGETLNAEGEPDEAVEFLDAADRESGSESGEGTPVEITDERPPDILDWIQSNFRSGVRSTSAADYGELVNQFAEASKGQKRGTTRQVRNMLSADKGEAADRVLKAMHEEGEYPRLQSEDDLIGAMVKAAQDRKAWEANRKAAPDRIEAWLNRAIEATKPGTDWTGSTALGVAKVPVWLAQEAAHGALQVARAAYRTGRDLAEAIGAAVEHVRGMNLPGFDAGELKDWLAGNLGERETGQRVASSTVVSDPVKDSITQYLYQKRSNVSDEELAAGIVKQSGLDGAVQILRDPPGNLSQATWSKLLGEVTRGLADGERDARARGDAATAAGLAQRQASLWDEMLPRITEMAQGLQALNDIVDMSPDAQVARLKNRLERAADEKVAKVAPAVETARAAIEEGRNAGVEQVRQDPAVNEAARKAVDEGVAESDEVKKAVIVELAGAGAQSRHIVLAAKQAMQGMMAEVLHGRERPAGMNAAQHARAILGDLSQRAAEIFAGHIQGAEPGVSIVKKLQDRLGLSESRAREVATQLGKEWDRQVKAAQEALPRRIAKAREQRQRDLGQSLHSSTAAVDAAIRRQLDALNVKLGQVLKAEASRQEETGAHVAERVVQASGLTGDAADTLRNTLRNRWDAIVTKAQIGALERMQKASGIKVTGKVKGAFDRAVELERLGALTSGRFYDVVKEKLGLKRLTAADAGELRRLVQRAQELPEGFLRQQAAGDVLKFTERASGDVNPWTDVPLAVWYANVLSGFTTPAKIVLENTNLLASSTVASFLSRPRELLDPAGFVKAIAGSYKRGLAKGALQAASTLKSGVVSGVWENARVPSILELKPFGEKLEALNFWKWFTRGISTAHETTFKPAWEFKQSLIARDVARGEGLKGKALDQRVADLMADTEGHWTQARAQAVNELRQTGTMSGLNLARRTREILEQQRETNMPGSTEQARDFALRTAYLNEPYGFMGMIAKGVRGGIEKLRQEYPVLGTGVKTQIPFTTVVANILNEKLNWTPVGLARAAVSHKTGELYGRDVMPGDRPELYAKAIVGTIALGAMAELFGDHIHGNGPSDPNKRKQLQAAGWVPHSLEWNGKYYSYMNTPAGLGLAVIGNVMDWHRYGKGDSTDGTGRAAFALKATANAIVSQGMLDSLKRVFESLGSESTTEGAEKLEKLAARTASSFVVPNLVQQVDRVFDPTVYDSTGMQALVRGQVPFARRYNKPALTVLGDPVQVGPFHYWAGEASQDPLLRTLADKQAWVPEPGRNQIIGDKKRGPDYYRAMTPDEYYDFIAMSGREIRRRLTENLDRIATAEPDQARKYVQHIAEEERAKAKKGFE